MLSDPLTIPAPGRITGFGAVEHGFISNEVLTRADGTQRDWPFGVGGDALLVRNPRAPGDGSQVPPPSGAWVDYAILSGPRRLLYGRALRDNQFGYERWLYMDPEGATWLCSLGAFSEFPVADGFARDVTVTRFGIFGGEPETYLMPVFLADIGQSTPEPIPAQYPESGFGTEVSVDGTTVVPRFESASSTGDDVIISLFAGPGTRSAVIGFLRLNLTGVPGIDLEITIAVHRTRSQTLGVIADELTDGVPPSGQLYRLGEQTTVNEEVIAQTGTGYPECSGTVTTRSVKSAVIEPVDSVLNDYSGAWVTAFEQRVSQTGRILAVAHRPDDSLVEWSIDCEWHREVDYPMPSITIGQSERITESYKRADDVENACIPGETISLNPFDDLAFQRVETVRETLGYTLRRDGAAVSTHTANYETVFDCTHYMVLDGTQAPPYYTTWTLTETYDVGFPGGRIVTTQGGLEGSLTSFSDAAPDPTLRGGGYSTGFDTPYLLLGLNVDRMIIPASPATFGPELPDYLEVHAVRSARHLVGIATVTENQWHYGTVSAPEGAVTAPADLATLTLWRYGAWNPLTGEILWPRQQDDAGWI